MNFTDVLSSAVTTLPALIIEVVGIVLAVLRWQRHPLASLLFVCGAAVRVMATVGYAVLPRLLMGTGSGMMLPLLGALGLVGNVGLALAVAAVFADRPERGPQLNRAHL